MALWHVPNAGTGSLSRRITGYVAAILLPSVAADVTFRTGLLTELPGALLLASIGFVASFWGLGSAVVSTVAGALLFNYLLTPPFRAWSLEPATLLRTGVFIGVGLAIAALSKQRRSAQERLQTALVEVQEQRDALIQAQEGAKATAWIFNVQERTTRWFPGGTGIFGRSYEEITAMGSPTSLVEEEDRPRIAEAAALTISSGVPFRVQFRVRWPNRELHWLEALGKPESGDPSKWRGVTMDITERKRAEAALIRSEKLAAAGRLASTIAHEINNPLEAITNLLYLAQMEIRSDAASLVYLQQAEHEIARLAGISRLTLSFVRKAPTGPVNVAEVVDGILALFESRCKARGISIRRCYSPGTMVAMPADQLRQILANLISNACDAALRETEAKMIEIRLAADAHAVMLDVSDNGIGISAEFLDRVFDPFFSTKDDTGTGIGLWVTKELIEKYGGRISVMSGNLPEGHKTSFHLEFPRAHSRE